MVVNCVNPWLGDGVAAVVASASGRVDALANVAGIMDGFLPPAEIDDQTWERVFAVNVTSMMRLTRRCCRSCWRRAGARS
jgi:NAD(P)-dependent dehydrogenase (short-subunit alcohol dehydrogenase family)